MLKFFEDEQKKLYAPDLLKQGHNKLGQHQKIWLREEKLCQYTRVDLKVCSIVRITVNQKHC